MELLNQNDAYTRSLIKESLKNTLKDAFKKDLKKEFMKVALASVDEIIEKISKEFDVFINEKENRLHLEKTIQLEWVLNKAWVEDEK